MNKLDDSRYDLIYLNPEDDAGSRVGDNYCQLLPVQTTLVEQKIGETESGSNLESESSQLQLIGGPASDGETKGPVESDAIDVGHSVFGSSHPDILKNDDGFYYCRYCKGCRSPILKEIIRHESTHLAPPTLCPFEKCGKTFSRKEHMHRHYLSHTGVRPYQCSVCEKRFIRKDHMVKHERRKHLPKRLQCRFCIHTFIDKKSLATHEEIIHENKRKVIKIEVEIKKENNNSNQFPEDISNVESSSSNQYHEDSLSVENNSSNQYHEDSLSVENNSSNQYHEDCLSLENNSSNQYPEDISNVESNHMHQYPEVMLNVEIDSDRTDTSLCENDNRLYSCRFCSYSSSHSGHLESHERTHTGDDETYVENVLLKECYVKCEMVEDDEPNEEEEEEEGEEVELDEVGGGGEGELELEMDNADEGGGGGRVEEEEMGRDNFDEGEREEEEEEVMERDDVGEEEEEEEDDSNEIEVDVNYSVLDKNPVHSILLNPGQKPSSLTCSYCSKEFSRRFSLIRHTRQVHVGEARQHCKFCERKYVRRDHLKKHLMAHLRKVERQRQKNCFDKELCEKEEEIRFELDGFAKKSANPFSGIVKLSRLKTSAAEGSWANQVQVVTGFDCRYCGDFTCDTRSELIAHEKSHGYRGFQCTYCDATFSRQHHLSRHVSSHTGERQFSCHMCDKSFYRKDHLDKHLRVHTGEKPFQCSFCDKTFGRQYTMRDHEKKHAEALLLNVQSPSKPLIEVCATDDKSLNT